MRRSVSDLTKHLNNIHNDESSEEQKDKPLVCLSTLHSSKGLEWPVVWIISMNEGVLPSPEGNADIVMREEERRLAFVGMTRAEDLLIVSSSNKVSTFLTESFPEVYSKEADWVRDEIIECEF